MNDISDILRTPVPSSLSQALSGLKEAMGTTAFEDFVSTTYAIAIEAMFKYQATNPLSFECLAAVVLLQPMHGFAEKPFFTPMRVQLYPNDNRQKDKVKSYYPYIRLLLETAKALPVVQRKFVFMGIPGVDLSCRFPLRQLQRITSLMMLTESEEHAIRRSREFGPGIRRTVLVIETSCAVQLSGVVIDADAADRPCFLFPGAAMYASRHVRVGSRVTIYLHHIVGNLELMYLK
jgi:hypothetical protein